MLGTIVEELINVLRLKVDNKSFQQGVKKTRDFGNKVNRVFNGIGAAISGVFIVGMNNAVSRTNALSQSVMMSSDNLQAFGNIVKELGFDIEKVPDIIEEMNNKLGESIGLGEQTTPVKEAMKGLKLDFQEIMKMKPEEQFKTILEAARNLEDGQQARSFADILMGGDAHRIVGLLRERNIAIDDLLKAQKRLIIMDDDIRKQATANTRAFNNLWQAISTTAQTVAISISTAFKPLVKTLTSFISENKELIVSVMKSKFVINSLAAAVTFLTVSLIALMGIGIIKFFKLLSAVLVLTGKSALTMWKRIFLPITIITGALFVLYGVMEEIKEIFFPTKNKKNIFDFISETIESAKKDLQDLKNWFVKTFGFETEEQKNKSSLIGSPSSADSIIGKNDVPIPQNMDKPQTSKEFRQSVTNNFNIDVGNKSVKEVIEEIKQTEEYKQQQVLNQFVTNLK